MKNLLNNFTTPEQSKRLLELGVPADSVDCVYTIWKNDTPSITYLFDYKFSSLVNDPDIQVEIKEGFMNITPCWSVGRLIEIYVYLTPREYVSLIFKKTFTPMDKILDKLEKDIANGMLDFSKLEE